MRKAVDPSRLGIGWKNDKLFTDLDFADDIARVAEDDHVCQEMTTNLAEHSAKFGLHVSQEKTKIIRTNQTPDSQPMYTEQAESECGDDFTYLGIVILKDEDVKKEVNTRLAKATTVFRRLDNVGRILSTKRTTDHRSYPEEQSNKRRSTERTGQRRLKDTTAERSTSSG